VKRQIRIHAETLCLPGTIHIEAKYGKFQREITDPEPANLAEQIPRAGRPTI